MLPNLFIISSGAYNLLPWTNIILSSFTLMVTLLHIVLIHFFQILYICFQFFKNFMIFTYTIL